VALRYDAKIPNFLAEKSFAVDQGARLVRKNIQDFIENAIARELIRDPEVSALALTVSEGEIVCGSKKK
jgi:ATP-dependent Clp protease ATP-binding subunit ClpA